MGRHGPFILKMSHCWQNLMFTVWGHTICFVLILLLLDDLKCVLHVSVICNLLWNRLKVFLTLFGDSELKEPRRAERKQEQHQVTSSTHKKKNREMGWKLAWRSTYRVWLWNPSTRHTYRTYLMDQNICKYLLFFIVMSQFSVSVSMWIWGHHVCYLLNYKMLCKQNLVPTKILKYFKSRYTTVIINEIVK